VPDHQKTLEQLKSEWEDCEKCELGVRRKQEGGAFVFGEGQPGGIMFIGEGPGRVEEEFGRPFIGDSGDLLRNAVMKLGLSHYYITNIVSCRSCSQAYDSEGQPRFRKNKRTGLNVPIIKDEPPSPLFIAACLPRLYEEVYLVDPVLIVALGGEAAKTLSTERMGGITAERGNTRPMDIPGVFHTAKLTPKKRVWRRKQKGEYVTPTEENRVSYLMLPTFHPAYVLRRFADRSPGNPLEMYLKDMKLAAEIYDRYMLEAFGTHPAERNLSYEDVMEDSNATV
jgi:uracil-DNA glycosylase